MNLTILEAHRQTAKEALETLHEDKNALILARQHGFITTGLEFVTDEGACPLCDTPWDSDELSEYLKNKLLSATKIRSTLDRLKASINELLDAFESRIAAIRKAEFYCSNLNPQVPCEKLNSYREELSIAKAALKEFLEDHVNTENALNAVNMSWWQLPVAVQAQINECKEAVSALPDGSVINNAREFLAVLEDRYKRVLTCRAILNNMDEKDSTAQKILEHYKQTSTTTLESIYTQVAENFSKFYRIINHEDEDSFVGNLKPEPAKLTLNVDFYGRGVFPPGAYHSEGHQDGMGLCLYLALMKHTLGNEFTFAVLDDVLMSVDTGHRREVCRLLKTKFPKTQFILTTHDRVWLQYMRTENLIQKSQTFGSWNVESGPRIWDDQDIWTEIEAELNKNDVVRAAGLLRHYLEYIATILADNLRVRIEFRSDARYDLGVLLPPVLKAWSQYLESGKKAAEHWGNTAKKDELQEMKAQAKVLIASANTEFWSINPSVHFNEWANLDKSEFQTVVNVFNKLLEQMRMR